MKLFEVGGRLATRSSIFLWNSKQRGYHDEQHAHRGLDKAVDAVPVEVANMHQQLDSSDGAWNAADGKGDHDLATYRALLEV